MTQTPREMLTILELVLKGGFRTSEFWVTLAGLGLTLVSPFVPGWVNSLHAQQQTANPVTGLALGLAAAVISGTYTLSRVLLKGKAADAAATIETAPDAPPTPPPNAIAIHLPSGNVMTPAGGSASLEESHRQAIVAATSALEVAKEALIRASNLPRPATFGASSSSAPTGAVTQPAGSNAAPLNPTSEQAAPVGSSSSSSGVSPGSI